MFKKFFVRKKKEVEVYELSYEKGTFIFTDSSGIRWGVDDMDAKMFVLGKVIFQSAAQQSVQSDGALCADCGKSPAMEGCTVCAECGL